jgi:hypothetical protein
VLAERQRLHELASEPAQETDGGRLGHGANEPGGADYNRPR